MFLGALRTAFENENDFSVETYISRPGSIDAVPDSNFDPLEIPSFSHTREFLYFLGDVETGFPVFPSRRQSSKTFFKVKLSV